MVKLIDRSEQFWLLPAQINTIFNMPYNKFPFHGPYGGPGTIIDVQLRSVPGDLPEFHIENFNQTSVDFHALDTPNTSMPKYGPMTIDVYKDVP